MTRSVCVLGQSYKRTHEETVKDYMQERQKIKCSFPYRSIEAWNKLDAEVINARNINDFKSKLDNSRFGDRTVPT